MTSEMFVRKSIRDLLQQVPSPIIRWAYDNLAESYLIELPSTLKGHSAVRSFESQVVDAFIKHFPEEGVIIFFSDDPLVSLEGVSPVYEEINSIWKGKDTEEVIELDELPPRKSTSSREELLRYAA